MSPLETEDDIRRAQDAVRYLIEQHGTDAVAESEAAYRHAAELNDKPTIEAFADILSLLRSSRST